MCCACRDHLDVMFGAGAPPLEWDKKELYTRNSIELYYLSHSAKPLSKEDVVEVREEGTWGLPTVVQARLSRLAAQHMAAS